MTKSMNEFKPSFTQIRRILSDCRLNPKEAGPLKIIADVGNPDYYRVRAMEMIQETLQEGVTHKIRNLKQAISLLALAVGTLENQQPVEIKHG